MSVRVAVPASSANLGPGYDAFGLALALYNWFEAEPADTWSVDVSGEGAGELPRDDRNEVARAIKRAFAKVGYSGAAHVRCENAIPVGRGLGSSSAAIVGGLVLAREIAGAALDSDALFALAVELEGHPDNVAAALLGGFTMCWHDGASPRVERLEPGAGLAVVAVISDTAVATSRARAALPSVVPHADAAFSVGRAGLLAAGIALGRAELIAAGATDRLHEPYREHLYPDISRVKSLLLECGADAAVLSGAGPTVVGLISALDDDAAASRATLVSDEFGRRGGADGRRTMVLSIDRRGAHTG